MTFWAHLIDMTTMTGTVRATENFRAVWAALAPKVKSSALPAVLGVACLALVATLGCSAGAPDSNSSGTVTRPATPHGGAPVEVQISREALENKPERPMHGTPEEAVRSYLAWTSYAYRIAQSDVATPAMTPYEQVRIDSYIQFNLQKNRIIDQSLESIEFGRPSTGATSTLVPVRERWRYRYVSTETVGETIGGPYSASYDATYTVVKSAVGWLVDSSVTRALGEVK